MIHLHDIILDTGEDPLVSLLEQVRAAVGHDRFVVVHTEGDATMDVTSVGDLMGALAPVGQVMDHGGGHVYVMVDRDLDEYPAVGTPVYVGTAP